MENKVATISFSGTIEMGGIKYAIELSGTGQPDGGGVIPTIPVQSDWGLSSVVIPHGSQGEWDYLIADAITPSTPIWFKDRYFMYYIGSPDTISMGRTMGVATSHDLINWTKYSNNPVLSYHPQPELSDEEGIFSTVALVEGEIIHMWYGALRATTSQWVDIDIRYCKSVDGYNFTGDTLVYKIKGQEISPFAAMIIGSVYYLYFLYPDANGMLNVIYGATPTQLINNKIIEAGVHTQPTGFVQFGNQKLFLHSQGYDNPNILVRAVDPVNPLAVSPVLRTWNFGVASDRSLYYDADKWYLYETVDNNINLRTA